MLLDSLDIAHEKFVESVLIDWLKQVMVETRFPGAPAVIFLAIAGDGDAPQAPVRFGERILLQFVCHA